MSKVAHTPYRSFKKNLVSLLLLLFVSLFFLDSFIVYAIPRNDLTDINRGTAAYRSSGDEDCEPDGNSDNNAGSGNAGAVYILGDSIGVGVKPKLEPLLPSSEGWSLRGDTREGRSLAEGITIAKSKPEGLTSAKYVLVILGTNNVNNSTNGEDIKTMVSEIKNANAESTIFWLKINVNRSDLTAGAAEFNALLSGTEGINLIDNSVPIPSGDIHPTAEGYEQLAATIAEKLGGGGSQGGIQNPIIAGGCTCSVSGSPELTGSDNAEKIWNYFISKGLTPEQVAGIMGNMQQESGLDPENIQEPGGRTRDPAPLTSKNQGWGLIQWTPGAKILGIAQQAGITSPIYELGTQLDIVWWHMNNISPTGARNMLPAFKNTTTIEEAVAMFEKKIEGAGTPALSNRIKFAKDFFALYAGGDSPSPSPISTSEGGCSDVSESGENTKYVDGFLIYNQKDPAWRDKPYSSSTIGESGCGPAAMAMIITALTGKRVTPVETAAYAAEKGLYVPGAGSSWSIGPVLAEHWGLKAVNIGVNAEKIAATLQAGGLVITAGQGAKPFTSGGHFLVIRAITESGKYKVGDSGHSDTSDKEWDPQQILASMAGRDGSVYAITK